MIYALGETVYDIIIKDNSVIKATPGGSALNCALSLGRVDCGISFISETGNDKISETIFSFLKTNNVGSSFITQYDDFKTSLALAFLDHNNDATYQFYKDFPKIRKLNFPEIRENDIILFSSSFALNTEIRTDLINFLDLAKKKNAILIYDPNIRDKAISDNKPKMQMIEENISFASIVKGSDEDFFSIFQTENFSKIFETIGADKMLIVTKNRKGAEMFVKNNHYAQSGIQITPISTIGAGDNFNAGIIYSIKKLEVTNKDLLNLQENSYREILRNGISFATEVCMSSDNYISFEFAKNNKF